MTVRPLTVRAERDTRATPAVLYRAWTSEFDRWFARRRRCRHVLGVLDERVPD